jgi:hypothetical protein
MYSSSRSRDSVVGIATGWATEELGFDSRYGKELSFLPVVQTGSGVHSTSCPMSSRASFPGVKRPVREADHSPLASAKVKKIWIYTFTPPYAFMR